MTASASSLKFRTEIEGLRGLLVLLVMLYHTGFSQFGGSYFVVDIFFLLSGYLMARVIQTDMAKSRFTLSGFYERRARRILPAFYLYIFVGLVASATLLPPQHYEAASQSALWALGLAGNFYFVDSNVSYFSPDTALQPFMHLWSLGLEQQYYLLIPLVFVGVIALRRPQWAVPVLAVSGLASFLYAISVVELHSQMAFYHFTTRFWEFALGSLLALNEVRLRARLPERCYGLAADCGAIVVAIVLVLGSSHWLHPGYPTLVPMLGAAMFIVFADPRSFFYKILSSKPLVFLGAISFSLYLSHQILFALAHWDSLNHIGWLGYLGLMLGAIALSTVTYRLVEVPFQNRKVVARGQFWGGAVAGTLGLGLVAVVISAGQGLPERFSPEVLEVFSESAGHTQKAQTRTGLDCYVESAGGRPCPIGDTSRPARWLLVGDSHAAALVSELDKALAESGVSGYAIIMGACAYARGRQPVGSIGKPCRRRNDWVQELLESDQLEGVILTSRYPYYLDEKPYDNGEGGVESGPQWWNELTMAAERGVSTEQSLISTFVDPIQAMLRQGKRVVLTYPVPEMGWNVPYYFYKSRLKGLEVEDISVNYRSYVERVSPITEAFDQLGQRENLYRVDPAKLFCAPATGRCSAMREGRLLYSDDDHLNALGAQILADTIVDGVESLSLTNRIVTRF